MKKNKVINIRVSEEEKRLLEKDAKEEARSVSNLLLWCWKEWRKNKKRRE
jgi:uncharacterized protein (DUF1778 family)